MPNNNSDKELNFQCSDCGVCFQDSEEGARLAMEHVRLTGHNEDLICTDVSELQRKVMKIIDDLSIVKPKKKLTELLEGFNERQ